eukprot:403374534
MLKNSTKLTNTISKNLLMPTNVAAFSREVDFRSTTILNVRKGDKVCMVGDGQISLGHTVFKNNARKLRRIQDNVICGFAGSAADCLALLELLEKEFEKHPGQTLRACLSLAKMWRTNKMHQTLQADMLVSDKEITCLVDGSGNCIEIENGAVAIGSGGLYAQAAATALLDVEGMDAEQIARKAMKIAADLCVYTNHTHSTLVLPSIKSRNNFNSIGLQSTQHRTIDSKRAVQDGLEMLDQKLSLQESKQNLSMLENRIKRLFFEDERAKKLSALANEKAEKLLKARDRHQRELEKKFMIQSIKKQQEDQLKMINRIQKEQHKIKVKQQKDHLIIRNTSAREHMQKNLRELSMKKTIDYEENLVRKQSQKQNIEEQLMLGYQNDNYKIQQIETAKKTQQNLEKLTQLEQMEKMLLNKLGQTQMTQREALFNFQKAVKVCNSGIDIENIKQKTSSFVNLQSQAAGGMIQNNKFNQQNVSASQGDFGDSVDERITQQRIQKNQVDQYQKYNIESGMLFITEGAETEPKKVQL